MEEPAERRPSARGAALFRLRLVPFFAAPAAVAAATTLLPVVEDGAPRWGWAALAFALVSGGVAFGGLLAAVLTTSLRRAPAPLRAMAREAAAREGARLSLVLRLPTGDAPLANAAAIPWARTMVVTDAAAALLSPEELGAVLAHEAGHLSEGLAVSAARLGAATVGLFVLTTGVLLAGTLPEATGMAVLVAGLLFAVGLLLAALRLARRMEERADARAAEAVGPGPLADALVRIHAHNQMPSVTGRRRVHPDLYDRLVALGRDPGPRPPPPPRGGSLLGLALAASLIAVPVAVLWASDLELADVRAAGEARARWRLRLDPWDAEAMLAAAWSARLAGRLDLARERAALAARMGPDREAYWQLWSELHAARGDCDAARDAFRRSLEAQAARLLEEDAPLRLGDYQLPPTLVADCELTVDDVY